MFAVYIVFSDGYCIDLVEKSEVLIVKLIRAYQLICSNCGILAGILWIVIGYSIEEAMCTYSEIERASIIHFVLRIIIILIGIIGTIKDFSLKSIFSMMIGINIPENSVSRYLRGCSSIIYFLHMWVISVWTLILGNVESGMTTYVACLTIIMILAIVLQNAKARYKCFVLI